MALNKIMACASLGNSLKDKLALALFGLIAPRSEWSRERWWHVFPSAIPQMWLRPKKLNGLRLLISPTNWSQTVIFEEVFLRGNYDLSKVRFTPEVIVDCGAHIGMFSLLAKSAFPSARHIAFEPNAENAQLMRRQITENEVDIELIESAISIEATELMFTASNSHSGRLLRNEYSCGAYKVGVVNFPETIKQMQPASLILKMDIEGEERNVFPVLMPSLPRKCALFFETHFGEEGWREIETLLSSNGFQVEQMNARGQCFDGFAYRE